MRDTPLSFPASPEETNTQSTLATADWGLGVWVSRTDHGSSLGL